MVDGVAVGELIGGEVSALDDDGFEEIIVGNFVIPGFTVNRSSNCQ